MDDVGESVVNCRLGLFGFLDLGSLGEELAGSASNGIRDQVLALEWVRDNIADYGASGGGSEPRGAGTLGRRAGGR